MKVKKSELRKRLPQLPINYPGPDVVPFDFELEKSKVENLCKRLADSEVEVRDSVLDELPTYLREVSAQYEARPKVTEPVAVTGAKKQKLTRKERLEMKIELQKKNFAGLDEDELSLLFSKLCLGLFFCYWHSDKPLPQHACAASISRLMHYPTTIEHKLVFLRCFLRVMSKKWVMVDQWRIDKYMSLMRKFTYEYFRLLNHLRISEDGSKTIEVPVPRKRSRDDDESEEKTVTTTVYEKTLKATIAIWQEEVVNGTSAGLPMHVSDIFLDELVHAKITSTDMFVALSQGIIVYTMQRGNNIEKRVVDHFFVPMASGRLEKLIAKPKGEEEADEDAKPKLAPDSLPIEIVKAMIEVVKKAGVSPLTQYAVRPLFSECQMYLEAYLEQRLAPEEFEPQNEKDTRLRLAKEVRSAARSRSSREDVVQKKIKKQKKEFYTKLGKGEIKTKGTTRRKK